MKPTHPAAISEELGNPSPPGLDNQRCSSKTVQQFEPQFPSSTMALPFGMAEWPRPFSSAIAKRLEYTGFNYDQESLHILVPLHTPALP